MIQVSEIVWPKENLLLSEGDINTYRNSGFIILKNLFSPAEVEKMKTLAAADMDPSQLMVKADLTGNETKLKMWNRPADDLYGMFSRNARLVDNVEKISGEEVYIYSSKMIIKNAKEGGAWEWHQDYGYWYNYGCLLPSMMSCSIAIDQATVRNGCLQVLRASQKIGRINHDRINDQTIVDPERLEAAKEKFQLEYVEMDPGDVLFFDGNLLHRSDANLSDFNRWSYIVSYNTVSNKPYKKVREYGNYEKLRKVPAEAILEF
ncbi:MAG TPA: phytanoyl-CoA dioxygenase family protein [Puia sp.]|nr:phytanoyl-CoA dioxygenase family protein [Puia sp.]